ncbi:DUF1835 domain-containing protein [Clostridiaceae bacterium UIB06]|uniref:DUF1835 domain-containing protein n=1 Tax=Clostridium thailandense TaxID=2794346 RepID=A0A949U1Q6_9CLOT|nr:DUF1835 domain-containing protein [Clostridium thailandense]MBV7274873.1 DUF1835 domain-containing protein [Clostridium thailandense]MCH5137618.1 DUF1835 domain-containing protein [Clostridiaceae bacterium UIB06]
MSKIIHIVFSESAEGCFKQAISKKIINGDKLIALYDNISNGAINNLKDVKNRSVWWNELNEEEDYFYYDKNELEDNYKKFYSNISEINSEDAVYLWYGHCDREICGMLYTLHLLKDKEVNLYGINVSDKIIENNQGRVFTYIANSASEIIVERLGEYFKLAKKIEIGEHERLLDNWRKLTKENSILRSYKNGEMLSVSEEYFDKEILKFTDKEYKKSARIVGDVLGNTEPRISDVYIFWRVKQLVKSDKLGYKGKFGVMREMEICITNEGLEYLCSFPEYMEFWNQRKRDKEKKLEFINEIKDQGKLEEQIRIAKNLLDVLEVETIAEKTGLTIGQVKNLRG